MQNDICFNSYLICEFRDKKINETSHRKVKETHLKVHDASIPIEEYKWLAPLFISIEKFTFAQERNVTMIPSSLTMQLTEGTKAARWSGRRGGRPITTIA
jgi:hypothetical protein